MATPTTETTESSFNGTTASSPTALDLLRESNFWIWFVAFFIPIGVFLCVSAIGVCLQRGKQLNAKSSDSTDDSMCGKCGATTGGKAVPETRGSNSLTVAEDDGFLENGTLSSNNTYSSTALPVTTAHIVQPAPGIFSPAPTCSNGEYHSFVDSNCDLSHEEQEHNYWFATGH